MIEVLLSGSPGVKSTRGPLSRDDHRLKELGLSRTGKRAPQRSRTHENYDLPPPIHAILQQLQITQSHSPTLENTTEAPQHKLAPKQVQPVRRRPPLGPPRRSYSVTDHEPIPHHHRPSANLTLVDIPSEIHYAIFDFLDPIDATCFGLTNRHFYAIHRRLNGTVPLSTRREGPNELEWAWHLAARTNSIPSPPTSGEKDRNALSKLRVKGQAYCRKCGVTRCELHKHIQDWMGESAEYCSVKRKFGTEAPVGVKPYCYMSKPGDPNRCGRHWVRKSKVVLK